MPPPQSALEQATLYTEEDEQRRVFDFDVRQVLKFIASNRTAQPPYAPNDWITPYTLDSAATWAGRLQPLGLPDPVPVFNTSTSKELHS